MRECQSLFLSCFHGLSALMRYWLFLTPVFGGPCTDEVVAIGNYYFSTPGGDLEISVLSDKSLRAEVYSNFGHDRIFVSYPLMHYRLQEDCKLAIAPSEYAAFTYHFDIDRPSSGGRREFVGEWFYDVDNKQIHAGGKWDHSPALTRKVDWLDFLRKKEKDTQVYFLKAKDVAFFEMQKCPKPISRLTPGTYHGCDEARSYCIVMRVKEGRSSVWFRLYLGKRRGAFKEFVAVETTLISELCRLHLEGVSGPSNDARDGGSLQYFLLDSLKRNSGTISEGEDKLLKMLKFEAKESRFSRVTGLYSKDSIWVLGLVLKIQQGSH